MLRAPALIVRPSDEPLPAVLWFHGFGVDKETHRPELERLAAAGFAAIGIDAAGHGERRLPDLAERQAGSRDEARATMLHPAEHVAVLSITAERDENVPPAAARRFHQQHSGTHKYVEIAGAEHLMNEEQWNVAMAEMIAWLTHHV